MKTRYELVHNNLESFLGCENIDDFVAEYELFVDFFREMKENGVKYDKNLSDPESDEFIFYTYDPEVAEQFGFEEVDEDDIFEE